MTPPHLSLIELALLKIVVSAVAGEISREPVDEFQGTAYLSKDLGARFMATHGVVNAFVLEPHDEACHWVLLGQAN